MANTILTDEVIAKEALMLLENNLVFARGVNRKYEKTFEGERKVGDTINVKKTPQYTVRTGATASIQNHTQESVPVVVDKQKGIDVEFTSKELALDLQDFSKEVLAPQIATLANTVDFDGLALYKSVPNAVAGSMADFDNYLNAGAILDENGTPMDDQRQIILNPRGQVSVVNGLKGLFQSSTQIKDQYEKGRMGTAAGFDWAMSQNIPVHTIGAHGGTPLTAAAGSAGGTTIATDGWTNSTLVLKEGDVVTFAGCYNVNPMSKQSTGQLKQFVVTADATSSAGGLATISFSPAMVATGATQNVSALPADNVAITVLGTASAQKAQNIAFHKDAFTLVTVDLPLPKGMDMAARASSAKAGLSIRFVRGYDITNDKFISRLDVLYGWKCIRPELACRIYG
jgi:P22 coat protein - gene protein 5